MTDTNKESLSALIDGEASEIEVHKLLRHVKSIEGEAGSISPETEDLHRSWARYQEIRSVIGPAGSRADGHSRMAASQHLALRLRISEAIEAEETHKLEGVSSLVGLTPRTAMVKYRAPAAGLAIAASLVVAIFVGLSPLEQETGNVDAIATIDASCGSTACLSANRVNYEIDRRSCEESSGGKDRRGEYAGTTTVV